jgi:hypothetical protein
MALVNLLFQSSSGLICLFAGLLLGRNL